MTLSSLRQLVSTLLSHPHVGIHTTEHKVVAGASIIAIIATYVPLFTFASPIDDFATAIQMMSDRGILSTPQTDQSIVQYATTDQVRTMIKKAKSSLSKSCSDPRYANLPGCTTLSALQPSNTPTSSSSRIETLRSLFDSVGISPASGVSGYTDVDGRISPDLVGYVKKARDIGCIDSVNVFRPYEQISQGELIKITACAVRYVTSTTPIDTSWIGNRNSTTQANTSMNSAPNTPSKSRETPTVIGLPTTVLNKPLSNQNNPLSQTGTSNGVTNALIANPYGSPYATTNYTPINYYNGYLPESSPDWTVSRDLFVGRNATIGGTLSSNGLVNSGTLTQNGNSTVNGSSQFNGNVAISGALSANSISTSSLSVPNSLTSTGNTMTSNIGGSVGTGSIINTSIISSSGNIITTSINGVTATGVLVNTHTISSSGNVLTSETNGVTTTGSIINTASLVSSGNIITTSINGVTATGDIITGNALSLSGNLLTSIINTISTSIALLSDNVAEGTTNLYYTTARFVADFTARFQSAFDSAFSNKTTDNLAEGTGSLYFTNQRAQNALSGTIAGINANIATLSGSLATLTTTVNTISGSLSTLSGTVASNFNTLSGSILTTNTTLSTLSGVVSTLTNTVNTISGSLNSLSGTVAILTTTVTNNYNTLSGGLATTNANLAVTNNTLSTLSGALASLTTTVNTISGSLNALSGSLNSLSGTVAILTTTVTNNYNTLSGALLTTNTNLTTTNNNLTNLSGSLVSLTNTVNTLSGTVTTISSNVTTMSGQIAVLQAASHAAVTLGTANGLSLAGQQLSLGLGSSTTTGALSMTDWNTFNSKQSFIPLGTTAQYYRGDKTWATLDTSVVTENGSLYFTVSRVRNALSTTGALTYSSSTGEFGDAFSFGNGLTRSGNTVGISSVTGTQLSGFTTGQLAFGTASGGLSSTGGLFWDNTNGRLGIGTNSPGSKLSIVGDIDASFGTDTTRIVGITTGFSAGKTGIFRFSDNTNQIENTYNGPNVYRAYWGHQFFDGPNPGGTEIARIGTTGGSANSYFLGNVGIGTTSPNSKLEITHGTAGNSGLRFTNLLSNSAPLTGNGKFLSVNSTGDVILTDASGAIGIGSSANGLTLSGTSLSLSLANSTTTGALSSTDWNTFNNKLNLTSLLTGFVSGSGIVAGTDNILQAFQKLQGSNTIQDTNITNLSGNLASTNASLASATGSIAALSGSLATTNSNLATTNTNLSTLSGTVVSNFTTLSGSLATKIGLSALSATGGISYNSGTGLFSWNGTTDRVTEGLSNLYYTTARFVADFTARFQSAFDSAFSNKTTDNLTEGTGSLYFTNQRAQNAMSGTITTLSGAINTLSGSLASLTTTVNTLSGVVANNYTALSGSIANTNSNLTFLSGTLSILTSSVNTLSGSLASLTNTINTISGSLTTETTNRINADTTLQNQINTVITNLSATNTNLATATGTISTLSGRTTINETNIATLSGSISTLSGQIVSVNSNLTTLSGSLSSLTSIVNSLSGTISSLQSQVSSLSGVVTLHTTQISTLSGSLANLQTQTASLSGQIVSVNSNLTTLSGSLSSLTTTVSTLSGIINTLSGQLQATNTNLATAIGNIATLSGNLATTNTNLTTLSGVVATKVGLSALSAVGPLTYNSTTGVFGITQSSSTASGFLSAIDWNTFNSKIDLTSLSATGGISYNSGTGLFSDLFTFSGGLTRTGNSIGISSVTGAQLSGFTSGQLTFGTATGGLTQSSGLFWDNTNGRLGIGTNSPVDALSVVGNLTLTGQIKLSALANGSANTPNFIIPSNNRLSFGETYYPPNDTGTVVSFASQSAVRNMLFSFGKTGVNTSFLGNNGTSMVIGEEGANPIVFKNNLNYTATDVLGSGNEWMRINGNGNVGIGTTTPNAKLEINSGIAGSGGLRFTQLLSSSASNGQFSGILGVNSTGDVGIAQLTGNSFTGFTAGQLTFGSATGGLTQSSGLFWDNTNARLGIGTNSPAYKLNIVDGNASLRFGAAIGATTDAFFQLRSQTTSNWARIGTNSSPLAILTQGTDETSTGVALFVNNNGNVGIGTTSPSMKLVVQDSTSTASGMHNKVFGAYSTALSVGASSQIAWGAGNSTNNQAEFNFYYAGNGSSSNYVGIGLFGTPSTLAVLANGSVGIGTTSPNSKFELNSGLSGTGGLRFTQLLSSSTPLTGNGKFLSVNSTGDVILTDATNSIGIGSSANGLTLSGTSLSLSLANSTTTGALSSTDWNTFNSKIGLTSLSATGGISYNSGTGLFSWNGTTDRVTEGLSNLYYTTARFVADFTARFQSAFDSAFSNKTTDNLAEGVINKYFTDSRVQSAMSGTIGSINTNLSTATGNISTLSGTVAGNFSILSGSLATKIGLTSLSATGGISYNSGTGLFSDIFTFSGGLTRIGNSIGISSVTGAQLSGFTAGQLAFGTASGGLTQSSNLFWNNTNNQIGTTNAATFSLMANNISALSVGRRTDLGLYVPSGSMSIFPYNQPNNITTYIRGTSGVSALEFEASAASFFKPVFYTDADGNFKMRGSSAGTDFFELGSAGTNNDGRLEFIIGDDGTEPIVFTSNQWNGSVINQEIFRLSRSASYFSIGNVGIGTTSPSAQLHTTGTVRFQNFGAGTLTTDASGNLSVSSDERLKDTQGNFTKGLSALENITPIAYKWNSTSGLETTGIYYGFSAQNVKESLPEAVGVDNRGYLTLSDRPILATLVNAVKELDQSKASTGSLEALSGSLATLSGQIALLSQSSGSISSTTVVNNYISSTSATGLIMSGTGQTATDALAIVQAEIPRSALAYITDMFAHAFEVVRDFVALQITAVRGYFDEIWAKSIVSDRVTTDQICLKKSDGTTICINGDQLQSMMNTASSISAPDTSSTVPPAPTTPVSTGSTESDSGSDSPSNSPIVQPPNTPILGCMDSTATNYSSTATEDDGSCTAPVVVPDPVTSPEPTTGSGS